MNVRLKGPGVKRQGFAVNPPMLGHEFVVEDAWGEFRTAVVEDIDYATGSFWVAGGLEYQIELVEPPKPS